MQRQVSNHKTNSSLLKLRSRITILSAGISALVLVVIMLTSLVITEKQLNNSTKRYLQGSLNSVVAQLRSENVVSYSWMSQMEAADHMILFILDGGTPLQFPGAWTPKTERSVLLQRAKEEAKKQGLLLDTYPGSLIEIPTAIFTVQGNYTDSYLGSAAIIPNDHGWQSVILLHDQSSEQQQIWLLRGAFGGLLLLGIGFLFWLCWLLAGQTIRPIVKSQQKQVEFVAAASHELRSPLAVIGASSSAFGISPNSDKALLATIQRECSRMNRLVDDLLTLARSDAGTWHITMTPIDLDSILLEVTEKFLPIISNKSQSLKLQVPDSTLPSVLGDAQRIEQILTILLDNAYSYTPEGSHIVLSAQFTEKKVIIKVSDDGPGIPVANRAQIFDRFYRGDTSRSKKEHCGLGLSIAKELAVLHNGKLYLENHLSSGATFVLELPRIHN